MSSLVKGSNMSAYFAGCIHAPMHYNSNSCEHVIFVKARRVLSVKK